MNSSPETLRIQLERRVSVRQKMKFGIAAFAALVGAASAVQDECVCTGGCNTYGDPHVTSFVGIQQKVPTPKTENVIDIYKTGDDSDSGSQFTFSVVAAKFNNGKQYVTKVQVDGKTIVDMSQCNNKVGDTFPFSFTIPASLNPAGFEKQEVTGYAVCSTKKGTACKDPANVGTLDRCPVFLNVFMNKTDTILVESSVASQQDFFALEQTQVKATGYCMASQGDSTVNNFTPAAATCVCSGSVPTVAPSQPFNLPTAAPTTSGTKTAGPTMAPTTSGTKTSGPTMAPSTSAPTCPPQCLPTPAPTAPEVPTAKPTTRPTSPSTPPSLAPTASPTYYCPPECTSSPTPVPTIPFMVPTAAPTAPKACSCKASCRTWRDPHVSTFDGSSYKTDVPGDRMNIYSVGPFSLEAQLTNDASVYQTAIIMNGQEIMNRDECPRAAKAFNDTFSVGGVMHTVTGNVECNVKKGTRFLDVLFSLETDFQSGAVQNPSNIVAIEKQLGADGECMDSSNPPNKAPWSCTC